MSLIAQQLSQQMFCGDELPAAVIDLGSCTSRFGTGGQDMPRHVFRSNVGIVDDGIKSSSSSTGRRIICGDMALRNVCDNVEISSPYSADGIHWENVEKLLDYGLTTCMNIEPKNYSVLFAENQFTDAASKQKLIELCFENFSIPAVYISPSSVLSSFSAGRATSLVVDLGASGTRVSPLIDGYVLKNAEVFTHRGGDWLDTIVSKELELAYPDNLKPWYQVTGKNHPVPRSSFQKMHITDIVRDVKKWMSFVPYVPVSRENRRAFIYETIALPPYELPDGTMVEHFDGLCTAVERLFMHDYCCVSKSGQPSLNTPATNPLPLDFRKMGNPKSYLPAHAQPIDFDPDQATLQELIMASVMKSDVDCRRELLANVVLVGGGSLVDGVTARLTAELAGAIPSSMKLKFNTQLPNERLHAAWIGGSVLSICGSFQQMWISKQEYEEYGVNLVNQRLL